MKKPKRTALEAWRLRRKMGIQDLAYKAGITEGTVVKLERLYTTRNPPARKTIDSLAGALRVPSHYLAGYSRSLIVLTKMDYYDVIRGDFPDPWHMPQHGEKIPMEQTLQEAGLDWDLAPEPEKDLDDEK
jgi:transcriptional regulator with XRE-family HTH domain